MNTSAAQNTTEPRVRLAGAAYFAYKRLVSPLLHSCGMTRCKYLPTCSEYAYVAVVRHGWLRGSWLAIRRLGRCNPFSGGGADPVP